MDMWMKWVFADAVRVNDVLMKYVTGIYVSPLIFNPAETTTYLNVNALYYVWNDLMEYALNDGSITTNDRNTMILARNMTDTNYQPAEPIEI